MKRKGKLSLGISKTDSIFTTQASQTTIALGTAMSELSLLVCDEADRFESYESACDDLTRYQKENVRYAEASEIEKDSCPHALKKWAGERIAPLKLPYEIKNRLIKPSLLECNDPQAVVHLFQLAEDFFQIAGFCREIQGMQIEMSPHANGMEFIIQFFGSPTRSETRAIEDAGLSLLFSNFSKENSMRLRVNASDEYVELQVIVLKSDSRMGMSPVE